MYDKARRNLRTMRYTFLATLIALATGLAVSQAEPRYCVGADKSAQGGNVQVFAVFENETVSFSHFTDRERPEGQQSRSPVLKEAQEKATLIDCITECQRLAPPDDQLNANLQDQYNEGYCRGLKFTEESDASKNRCMLYKVAPNSVRTASKKLQDRYSFIGGATIGACSDGMNMKITEYYQGSCCELWVDKVV
ncbi:hypothetical protein FFLO_03330 [Filobasidium floriforme]|uniref:Uncharacterized protein n=1 Tax=Filobasidium floriforme TaxID=5210 RepID=A0A8K0JKX5_9TREE|nr:hypothetical protein FFLO_03330 [Filobasidium floriforme]